MIDPALIALGLGAAYLLLRKQPEGEVVTEDAPATSGPIVDPYAPPATSADVYAPMPPVYSGPAPAIQQPTITHSDPVVTVTAPPAGSGFTLAPIAPTESSATLRTLSRLSPTATARLAPGQRFVVQPGGQLSVTTPPPRPLEILRAQGLRTLYGLLSQIRPALNTYNLRRRAEDQRLASNTSAQWSMQASEWRKANNRLAAASRLAGWDTALRPIEAQIKAARNEQQVRDAIRPVNTAASAVPRDISLLGAP